jgi:hypothetical protein
VMLSSLPLMWRTTPNIKVDNSRSWVATFVCLSHGLVTLNYALGLAFAAAGGATTYLFYCGAFVIIWAISTYLSPRFSAEAVHPCCWNPFAA